MAVNDILEIGRQGLMANRKAMETASNNIANANTPGYTRRRAVMEANGQAVSGNVLVGGGVDVKKVVRLHDPFIQGQILDHSRSLGAARAKADTVHQVESLFSGDAYRLGGLVSGFFGAVRELSVQPEAAAMRDAVVRSADSLAGGFREMSGTLERMKIDIDARIENEVGAANGMMREMAALNGQISQLSRTGHEVNELLDQREGLARTLAQKLGFEISGDDQGNLNLTASGLGILVSGTEANELQVARTAERGQKAAGSLDISLKDAFGLRVVTGAIEQGEIGGLVAARDRVVQTTLGELDRIAHSLGTAVNGIHREGTGADGLGERDLFAVGEDARGAASRIDVDSGLKTDASALSLGYGDAPGENAVLLAIAELESPGVAGTGASERNVATGESLSVLAGRIGVIARDDYGARSHQEALVQQLENYRESLSGVSLEEESVDLLRYQAVFNASAKAMRVGDELLQTILSIKP